MMHNKNAPYLTYTYEKIQNILLTLTKLSFFLYFPYFPQYSIPEEESQNLAYPE